MMRIFVEKRDLVGIKSVLERWVAANPNDGAVKQALDQINSGWSPFDDPSLKNPPPAGAPTK
jgi:hypothetical protein